MNGAGGASGGGGPGPAQLTCANCGAPDSGEHVMCKFCRQAVSAEVARSAIPCPNPQCRTQCRWGRQKCIQCQAWIVVSCVFCGSLSPYNVSNCMRCNEGFAGAAQRKAQMEHNQRMNQGGQQGQGQVWQGVAASFLGAATGVAIGGMFHSHDGCSSWDSDSGPSSSSSFDVGDVSDVSDDTGFDFGGGDD